MQLHQPQHSSGSPFLFLKENNYLYIQDLCGIGLLGMCLNRQVFCELLNVFKQVQIFWLAELLQMFFSIGFAAEGVAGALYSFIVAVAGIGNGPLCFSNGEWTRPFKDRWRAELSRWHWWRSHDVPVIYKPLLLPSNASYISDSKKWAVCTEPKNVVQFNTGLFGTLIAVSCLQVILCAIQTINGLFGCLGGTCNKSEVKLKKSHSSSSFGPNQNIYVIWWDLNVSPPLSFAFFFFFFNRQRPLIKYLHSSFGESTAIHR